MSVIKIIPLVSIRAQIDSWPGSQVEVETLKHGWNTRTRCQTEIPYTELF